MHRLIIQLDSIQDAIDLANSRSQLNYFKQNLIYSYINDEELQKQIKDFKEEGGTGTPSFICPYTNLIGKLDTTYRGA